MIGVDTNVILNVLRKDDPLLHKKGSLEFFRSAQHKKIDLAISVITLTELFRKPFRDNSTEEKQKVDSFLHLINAKTIIISNDSAIDAESLLIIMVFALIKNSASSSLMHSLPLRLILQT